MIAGFSQHEFWPLCENCDERRPCVISVDGSSGETSQCCQCRGAGEPCDDCIVEPLKCRKCRKARPCVHYEDLSVDEQVSKCCECRGDGGPCADCMAGDRS